MVLQNENGTPFMDFDSKSRDEVIEYLQPSIEKYKLGNFLLAKTKNGYHVFFHNDVGRIDAEQIIQETKGVDKKFKDISKNQDWRALRVVGKHTPYDITFVAEIDTPYPGQGDKNKGEFYKAFLSSIWKQVE